MLITKDVKFEKAEFDKLLKQMIKQYISNHKVSNVAHEEIMSMVHSDKRVSEYYYKREFEITNTLKDILVDNNFKDEDLYEKVHIMRGLIDNLCHEIIYHKHDDMDYDLMTNLVTENIKNLLKKRSSLIRSFYYNRKILIVR